MIPPTNRIDQMKVQGFPRLLADLNILNRRIRKLRLCDLVVSSHGWTTKSTNSDHYIWVKYVWHD